MRLALLIDFGSTYTKLTAVDLERAAVAATAKAPTTVDTDIMEGLGRATRLLEAQLPRPFEYAEKLASSSAAGGLRMCALGLVPSLTVEAARMAALGSGAKLVGHYAYELGPADVADLCAKSPDIVLLAGGTDGGNRDVILHNAGQLAASALQAPVVMAGNRSAQSEVEEIFRSAGKDVVLCENVLPELDRLNIGPVRAAIREIFISRITRAKGIDRAAGFASILMPTPVAVLQGARLLAEGAEDENGREPGLGDLLVVDIGGATTDVHSIGLGLPAREHTVSLKGIPEPYDKRTVEGDLGVRYNMASILEEAGEEAFCAAAGVSRAQLEDYLGRVRENTGLLAATAAEQSIDLHLARVAAKTAVTRHAGHIESYYTPLGVTFAQYGKDLTAFPAVIGTGGPLVHSEDAHGILGAVLWDEREPERLRPKAPAFYIDRSYILYAVGLLGAKHPRLAVRLAKKYLLQEWETGGTADGTA